MGLAVAFAVAIAGTWVIFATAFGHSLSNTENQKRALQKQVTALEDENRQLKDQLADPIPAKASLERE